MRPLQVGPLLLIINDFIFLPLRTVMYVCYVMYCAIIFYFRFDVVNKLKLCIK